MLKNTLKEIFLGIPMWIRFSTFTFLFICLIAISCSTILRNVEYTEDSLVEEILEGVIESHTGIDVDLTPNSKEIR